MSKYRQPLKSQQEEALLRAKSILAEHFENVAIFLNWVGEDGFTRCASVLAGNALAIQFQLERWLDMQEIGSSGEDNQEATQL